MPPGYARANHQTPLRLKRLLLPSTAFIRSGRRFARKQPQARRTGIKLALLAADAFHPQLKTHKLKGSSPLLGVQCRLRFTGGLSVCAAQGCGAILLESLGTHDQVY